MQIIVGLKGPAGSGKSTVAKMLVDNHNFVEIALADVFKRFVGDVFDIPQSTLWGPSVERSKPLKDWPTRKAVAEVEPGQLHEGVDVEWLTARRILQTCGTEWGQGLHPDVWTRYVLKTADELLRFRSVNYTSPRGLDCSYGDSPLRPHYAGVVISDVRFHREVHGIVGNGRFPGWVWNLRGRKGATVGGTHRSETEPLERTPGVEFWGVDTACTLEQTERRVKDLLEVHARLALGLTLEQADKFRENMLLRPAPAVEDDDG